MSVSRISRLSTKDPITGNTIFHEAAKAGSLELLYIIRDNMGESYCHLGEHFRILREMNNDGETCIHVAVEKHKGLHAINLVKALVELGADLNAQHGSSLCTALFLSVYNGDHELAEWLCQQPGIDLRARNWDSMTVLDYAHLMEDQRMVDILLAAVQADDGNAEESDSETSDNSE